MFSCNISCNLMELNWLPASTSLSKLQFVAFDWNRVQIMLKFPLFFLFFSVFNIHTAHFLQCSHLYSGNNFHFTCSGISSYFMVLKDMVCKDFIPLFHFYWCHSSQLYHEPLCFFVPQTHTHTPSKITTTQLRPACPPSRPPPWAARAQGFPRVSGWGLDNPSLVRTVITEGHLSMLFPFRQWEKQATGEIQKSPGNPDAPST